MIRKLTFLLLALLTAACAPLTGPAVQPSATAAPGATAPAATATTTPVPPSPMPTQTAAPTASLTAPPPAVRALTGLGPEGSPVQSVSFSTKEPWLVALLGYNTTAQVIDYATGQTVRTIPNVIPMGGMAPLVFQPGSTLFASGSGDHEVALWDAAVTPADNPATGHPVRRFAGPADQSPMSLAFSPDGSLLAAGFWKEARVWNAADGRLVGTVAPNFNPNWITALAFSPDGKTLAVGAGSGVLMAWDAASGQAKTVGYGHFGALAYSPDGSLLATAALGSPAALWDTSTWVKRVVLPGVTHAGSEASLAFSPDGRILAVCTGGKTVDIWDVERAQKVVELAADTDYIQSIAYAPDGHTLAAGLPNQTLMLWDLRQAAPLQGSAPSVGVTAAPDALTYIFPQAVQPGAPLAVDRVQMFDARSGWGFASDGTMQTPDSKAHLLHTAGGGHTWYEAGPADVEPGEFFALDATTAWTLPAFHYRSDAQGVLIPYEKLTTWRTTDAGRTWQQGQPFSLAAQGLPGSGADDYSPQMQFFDRNNGVMLINIECAAARTCMWQFYQTADGGMHWQRVSEANPQSGTDYAGLIFSILFWDKNNGWGTGSVLGFGGAAPDWNVSLASTRDGGRTWQDLLIPAPAQLPEDFTGNPFECGGAGLEQINDSAAGVRTQCMVYKNDAYPRYSFYHLTPDRGKTWRAWLSNGTEDFISGVTGWRLEPTGEDQPTRILRTDDSGATWNVVSTVPWFGKLYFVTDQVGFAVAEKAEARALVMTEDGGKTWVEVKAAVGGK